MSEIVIEVISEEFCTRVKVDGRDCETISDSNFRIGEVLENIVKFMPIENTIVKYSLKRQYHDKRY